jgi:hypothetical protein
MNESSFDTLVRHAGEPQDRRSSLMALGGAALAAAFAAPPTAEAGKSGKKAKKKCNNQVNQCKQAANAQCRNEICRSLFNQCCPKLNGCHAGEFVACLLAD